MRPITCGDAKDDAGVAFAFTKYEDAKPHLSKRIGNFCVFCERKIPTSLAVEHKQPKSLSKYAHLVCDWTNFVLGCANCNSTKGKKDTGIETYFFPDEVNTAYVFVYQESNVIEPNASLNTTELDAARRTLSMVGLDRPEFMPHTRWTDRGQAWEKAKRYRTRVAANDTPDTWDYVLDYVAATGFWSVWMRVFQDHAEIRKRLIAAFPGTRTTCFDADGNTIPDLKR